MRRRWKALVAVVVIATGLGCGKSRTLVGSWKLEASEGQSVSSMKFGPNGSWESRFTVAGLSRHSRGTYSLQDSVVVINVVEDLGSDGKFHERPDTELEARLEWLGENRIRWTPSRPVSAKIWVRE